MKENQNQTVYRQKSRIHVAVIVLIFLFLANRQEAFAAGTVGNQAEILSLYNKNPQENASFQMTNMFPGDSKTQYYRVNVSYTGTITVSFRATVKEGSEKLGEGLKAKVRLVNTDEVIYEGAIADMPQLDYIMAAGDESKTEEICYEITAGLGTDAGNEYQNQSLSVNLDWWVEVPGEDDPTEPTDPSEGEDPTEPTDPSEGEDPTEPTNPSEGEDSTEPTDPSEGEDPTKPSEPDEGDEPSDSDDKESDDSQGGSLIDPPGTGDNSQMMIWTAILSVSLVAMILVLMRYRRKVLLTGTSAGTCQTAQYEQSGQMNAQKMRKRLMLGIFLTVLLIVAFGITSLALIYQKVTVEENLFQTGKVSISLNDNQPVFAEDILFEPGMVVEKEFTLRNDSSCDVYYRLYFSEVEGEFAEVLKVTVGDGENTIFQGTLAEMNGVKSEGAPGLLNEGESCRMKITFHVPEDCGNLMQGRTILFDLNAEAVQAVNNPDGLF